MANCQEAYVEMTNFKAYKEGLAQIPLEGLLRLESYIEAGEPLLFDCELYLYDQLDGTFEGA